MKSLKDNNKLFLVLLALFVIASFRPVLNNQFINLDDNKFIYNNKLIQNERIEYSSILKEQIFTPNYKPLVYFFWSIEYKLFLNNSEGYHLISLLLHIFNSILVLLIISVLIRKFFQLKNASVIAFISTIIFALHPLKVESVAWAVELKDMLFAFFFFFSLISYLYFLKDKKSVFFIISIVTFSFGIFSKSMIISLPVVLLAVDYLYGRSLKERIILEKWPFFIILCFGLYLYGVRIQFILALLCLFFVSAYYLKNGFELKLKNKKAVFLSVVVLSVIFIIGLWIANYSGLNTVIIRSKGDFALSDQPVVNFIVIASYRICMWLAKLIYPFSLSLVYKVPDFLVGSQFAFYTLLLPVSLLAVVSLVIFFFRSNRYIIFIIAYFSITIFPAIISSPAGTNFLPDRYTYISSLSYCLVFVLFFNLAKKYSFYLYTILCLYAICLGVRTNLYSKEWKDSISIWTAALKSNETWQAYFNRSQAYFALKDYEKSYSDISRAIEIDSTSSDSYFNRGLTLIPLKNYNKAIDDFDMTLRLNPNNFKAITYKAMCYFYLGNYSEAISLCNLALKKEPLNTKTYLTRAIAKEKLLDFDGAIVDFTALINLEPQNGENYYRRGITKLLKGDTSGSCEDWRISRKMNFTKASEMITKYCK
jgi:protein O-mannosyl-transferase